MRDRGGEGEMGWGEGRDGGGGREIEERRASEGDRGEKGK